MTSFDIVEGIIYRIQDKNPSDKLIYLISEEGEKVVQLAKNVKTQTSKRAQSIELGNLIRSKYIPGYNIGILTDIKVLKEFLHWKKDFKNMIFLQLICEIVSHYTFENIKEEGIYQILLSLLSSKSERIEYLTSIFILKILNLTGHLPDLSQDVLSGEELGSSSAFLIPGQIGYIKEGTAISKKIQDRIYKTQRFVLQVNLDNALKLNLSVDEDRELLKLHLDWLEISLDKKLKSREILSMFRI